MMHLPEVLSATLILSIRLACGFAPTSPRGFRSSRAIISTLNAAENEMPLDQTNNGAAAPLSDDQLQLVARYKQLLEKKFPATMVRHTMTKEGNDSPDMLREVFQELGDDNKIDEVTKPRPQVKKKARATTDASVQRRAGSYEDPTGFFPGHGGHGGYVPAGLTEEEYAKLKRKESDEKVGKNYAAWGPRFKPSDGPVADDMAWMAMPDLWTGKTSEGRLGGENGGTCINDEDPELPLHDPGFLSNSRPWNHADAKRSDAYLKGWRSTYKRFCEGETVQQLMLDVVSFEKVVRHILEGVVVYGGKDMSDSQTCLDLNRVGIYSPPNKSDWDVMVEAETKVFGGFQGGIVAQADTIDDGSGELMLCGHISRSDLLRTIVRIGQNSGSVSEDDVLARFDGEDLQEMYLCMDWFVALRRIGISRPFDD